ncbi:MAG: trypsin-like peptidase domain-containing protein, partial [Verrucomicrobiales bacterium]|nr:trypsin-like peptidase domain-containing protein [Verrucomicrobiales bacterium]
HPVLDLALVKVRPISQLEPVRLERHPVADISKTNVAVIGYPMACRSEDKKQCDEFFAGQPPFGLKRIAPGRLIPATTGNSPAGANVVRHDCTTLHGSSGSPIVNLDTGNVIALHFAEDPESAYLQRIGNFAVKLNAVASDPKLRSDDWHLNWTE